MIFTNTNVYLNEDLVPLVGVHLTTNKLGNDQNETENDLRVIKI